MQVARCVAQGVDIPKEVMAPAAFREKAYIQDVETVLSFPVLLTLPVLRARPPPPYLCTLHV